MKIQEPTTTGTQDNPQRQAALHVTDPSVSLHRLPRQIEELCTKPCAQLTQTHPPPPNNSILINTIASIGHDHFPPPQPLFAPRTKADTTHPRSSQRLVQSQEIQGHSQLNSSQEILCKHQPEHTILNSSHNPKDTLHVSPTAGTNTNTTSPLAQPTLHPEAWAVEKTREHPSDTVDPVVQSGQMENSIDTETRHHTHRSRPNTTPEAAFMDEAITNAQASRPTTTLTTVPKPRRRGGHKRLLLQYHYPHVSGQKKLTYFQGASLQCDLHDQWGHSLESIDSTSTFRLFLQNPNGLNPYSGNYSLLQDLQTCQKYGAALLALPETNVNWEEGESV